MKRAMHNAKVEREKINTSVGQLTAISRILKIHPKELFDFEIKL